VGVALGASGTPAARAAADLVVTDDRLETIIDAIVEGRAMWRSIRDALAILVGGNLGEIGFTVAASVASRRPPLSARQLLLVNLLTDLAPAMAIALRPPTDKTPETLLREGPEASLGAALSRDITMRAAATAAGATGGWAAARVTGSASRASTVGLVALVGTQLGQTLATAGRSPLVVATGLGSAAALATIVQTPGLSHFFGCRPLGPLDWLQATTPAALATAGSVVAERLLRARGASTADTQRAQVTRDPHHPKEV
jgi:cation-transporting P-type ATPase I